jgi:hypothetical protein
MLGHGDMSIAPRLMNADAFYWRRLASRVVGVSSMRKHYLTPEEVAAKRAYFARGQQILSGAALGLFEKDRKVVRKEVRALIEAELEIVSHGVV